MNFEYFFMFPVGFIVATIAMSTLVGGATFFAPFFILVLKLEPHISVSVALMIQFFGFGTGLIRNITEKNIDYSMGFVLVCITIPYAIIGSYLGTLLNPFYIRLLLGLIVIYIGYNLSKSNTIYVKERGKKVRKFNLNLFKRKNTRIVFTFNEFKNSVFYTSIGGLFLGMTSAGLGEIVGFSWIKKTDANLNVIVGTTIFVIAITTFVTSLTHFYKLFTTNIDGLIKSLDILIFAIPGVILGAIFGTYLLKQIDPEKLNKFIAIILIITGIICFIPF